MTRLRPKKAASRLAAMPGRAQISLLACLCAAALAGCGSDDGGTIPSQNSAALLSLLSGIEENVAGGNCDLAQEQAGDFVDEVNQLPADVGSEVKGALQAAAARLVDLAADPEQCEAITGDTGLGGVQSTPVEPTTEPEVTTTEEMTTETTTEPPPDEGDDDSDDGGGPPETPPGQDGTPPGQSDGDEGGGSGGVGIGGDREATR